MKKHIYRKDTNHILLSQANDTIKLDEQGSSYVIGIAIENLATNDGVLVYGLNEAPKIELQVGDSRSYGGMQIEGIPLAFTGEINYRFDSTTTKFKGLLIITRWYPESIGCVDLPD